MEQIAVVLEELRSVGGRTRLDPFERLAEIVFVPAATDDHQHVLELGTLDAVLGGKGGNPVYSFLNRAIRVKSVRSRSARPTAIPRFTAGLAMTVSNGFVA